MVHIPKQVNAAACSRLSPCFKAGTNFFTQASTGKYIKYSAFNKLNQEHSAPQKRYRNAL